MMCFGWRPTMSCYSDVNKPNGQNAAACAQPNWFYALLGLAVIGGLAAKGKK